MMSDEGTGAVRKDEGEGEEEAEAEAEAAQEEEEIEETEEAEEETRRVLLAAPANHAEMISVVRSDT
jgi:hypothetical protein